jgi:excisionase family DNA binding protein
MKNIYTSWEQVPLYLTIDELALLMGISRAGAYSLAHSEGFPLTRWGKRMAVSKDKLLDWLDDHSRTSQAINRNRPPGASRVALE